MSVTHAIVRERSNPLAPVAARICAANGHSYPRRDSGVACVPCWGEAIRRDERIRVEEGLPDSPGEDIGLVDEVAVARFVAGEGDKPKLTLTEKAVAAKRLLESGASRFDTQRRLGVSTPMWWRLTAVIHGDAPISTLA